MGIDVSILRLYSSYQFLLAIEDKYRGKNLRKNRGKKLDEILQRGLLNTIDWNLQYIGMRQNNS